MADTYTTNLNLTKPEPGAAEDTWGISLNADLDSLDAIFSSSGTQINLNPNQVNFADGKKAIFGTGSDLQIYHSGTNSIISEQGTGVLEVRTNGTEIQLTGNSGTDYMARFVSNGKTQLHYDGSAKLDTTSTGINVTGTAEVDVLSIGGTAITATATELNYVDGVTGSIQTQLGTKIENSDDVNLGTISSGAITSTGNSQMANLVVTGDLTVQGTTTTVNTDDLNVKDKNITLNYSTGDSSASANGAGITIQDAVSAGNDATILWNTNFDNFDFSHTIRIPDSQKVEFGADADLQIYHESGNNHSVIKETGTGNLKIQAANIEMQIPNGTQNYLQAINGGAVTLYNNGSPKIATTSSGIDVTGTVVTDGLTVAGTSYIQSTTQPQLEIAYNSGNITGFYRSGGDFQIKNDNGAGTPETSIVLAEDGAVTLYHDASAKLATTSTGATITGTLDVDVISNASGVVHLNDTLYFQDNSKAVFGDSSDLQIYHDGSNSYVQDAGDGELRLNSDNGVRIRKHDNETLALFSVDGSASLWYDNAQKISTTSTGINVTGTVTSDGLTVDGAAQLNGDLTIFDGTGDPFIKLQTNEQQYVLRIDNSESDVFQIRDTTNSANRLAIANNGDISFYDDTGTTAKFFWDSSAEALGIGTTSPSQDLEILNGVSGSGIRLAATSTAYWDIERDPTSGHLTFTDDGAGTVLTVGQDGKVGIGTSSPATTLTVAGSSANGIELDRNGADATQSARLFFDSSTSGYALMNVAGSLTFNSGSTAGSSSGTERMRIDSSGNVLVGKTSASSASIGFQAGQDGFTAITRASAQPLVLNRTTNDGIIAEFKKDSTQVGTIGTSTTDLFIGTGVAGLRFREAGSQLMPWNTTTNAANDNAIDIGKTDARFKDLHLSGTINSTKYDIHNEGGGSLYQTDGYIRFANGNTETVRIDASGNLLVGKTSTTFNTAGSVSYATGLLTATVDGNACVQLNRLSSDGVIQTFGKDGSTIGTIGVAASNNLYIGASAANHAGLYFSDDGTNGVISPIEAGSLIDNSVSLGSGSYRFKDLYLSGSVTTGDGTAASPAIKVGDNDTGLFQPTDNVLAFSAWGTERMRINPYGNVGIGTTLFTTNPYVKEAVVKSTVTDGVARYTLTTTDNALGAAISLSSFNDANTLSFGLQTSYDEDGTSAPTPRMTIDSSGNVGIGTSSPSFSLDVRTADNNVAQFKSTDASATVFIADNSSSSAIRNNLGVLTLSADEGDTSSGTAIVFQTDTAERARINSSGNVGIGYSSPAQKLHIVSTDGSNIILNSNTAAENNGIFMTEGSAASPYTNGAYVAYDGANNAFKIKTGTTTLSTRLTILRDNGNVGIGTTSPACHLEVSGSGNGSVSDHLRITSTDTQAKLAFVTTTGNGAIYQNGYDLVFATNTANTERMRLDSSGNLLVAQSSTTTPGTGNTTTGISLRDVGAIHASRDGNRSLYVNRNTTDGQIISVQKDGTEVGSIGVINTNNLTIGGSVSNHSGLQFGTAVITPMRAGAESDAQIDIGFSNARFKDLYLSGTANVGTITSSGSGTFGNTLTVNNVGSNGGIRLISPNTATSFVDFGDPQDSNVGLIAYDHSVNEMFIKTNANEALRLDSSQNATFAGTISSGAIYTTGNLTASNGVLRVGLDNTTSGAIDVYGGSAGVEGGEIRLHTTNGYDSTYEWYRIDAYQDDLRIGRQGNTDITLDSSGNVGIGTTHPDSKLDVTGGDITVNTTGTGFMNFKYSNSSKGTIGTDGIDLKITASADLQLLPTGNVGIGTTSPSEKLHVLGNTKITGTITVGASHTIGDATATDDNLLIASADNKNLTIKAGDDSSTLRLKTTNTALTINPEGLVTIEEETTINDDLTINATTPSLNLIDTNNNSDYAVNNANGVFQIFDKTNDVSRLSVTSAGNVGIGTSSPANKLDIKGTVGFEATNSTNKWLAYTYTDNTLRLNYNGAGADEVVIDSSGNVGIGVTNPSSYWGQADNLVVGGTGNDGITIKSSTSGNGRLVFTDTASSTAGLNDGGQIHYHHGSDYMALRTNGSERLRIDSSGRLLVGKTAVDNTTVGFRFDGSSGFASFVRDGGEPLYLNRKTSDGELVKLAKDGAVGGVIGIQEPQDNAEELYIANGTGTSSVGLAFWDYINTARIAPCSGDGAYRDNAIDLGYSGARFDDIYATNGTIQTSDENEKQDIQALTDAEQRVATACKGLIRRFRWKDAVAEKGDDARLHFGVIAQDLQDAFEAEGLDAGDYGMFISQTWEDDDGVEQTRLGVRYNELLAFIITTL